MCCSQRRLFCREIKQFFFLSDVHVFWMYDVLPYDSHMPNSSSLLLLLLVLQCYSNILIYIQHDATLHSLFYLETALRISGVTILMVIY